MTSVYAMLKSGERALNGNGHNYYAIRGRTFATYSISWYVIITSQSISFISLANNHKLKRIKTSRKIKIEENCSLHIELQIYQLGN